MHHIVICALPGCAIYFHYYYYYYYYYYLLQLGCHPVAVVILHVQQTLVLRD